MIPNLLYMSPRDAPRVKNPGGAGSNAGRRRCPAAPSDLPKSGGGGQLPHLPHPLVHPCRLVSWNSKGTLNVILLLFYLILFF